MTGRLGSPGAGAAGTSRILPVAGRCAVFGAKTRAPSSFCASCALRRSSTVLKGSLMASSSVALLGVAER